MNLMTATIGQSMRFLDVLLIDLLLSAILCREIRFRWRGARDSAALGILAQSREPLTADRVELSEFFQREFEASSRLLIAESPRIDAVGLHRKRSATNWSWKS